MGLEIELSWQKPIRLTSRGKLVASEEDIILKIGLKQAGVYVFSRKYGNKLIPFYIGQSIRLRGRLRDHLLRNVRLRRAIDGYGEDAEAIGQGSRYFHHALLTGSRRNIKKRLDIVERALIRKAVADGLYLVNKNSIKIATHIVRSSGPSEYRAIFDRTVSVESQE